MSILQKNGRGIAWRARDVTFRAWMSFLQNANQSYDKTPLEEPPFIKYRNQILTNATSFSLQPQSLSSVPTSDVPVASSPVPTTTYVYRDKVAR